MFEMLHRWFGSDSDKAQSAKTYKPLQTFLDALETDFRNSLAELLHKRRGEIDNLFHYRRCLYVVCASDGAVSK